ncbi:MAG TPA: class I SAM-dependent methyltransferase [Desulfobacteraceae bacterium]|jgi:ubiquinone/menaquinone biosynthesis C-methylase UbiE|nr:class I SAM-dependent methyltransferase [Desulfobacteraceae bacterium]
MGIVFDKTLGRAYDRWCHSGDGRMIDHCLPRLITTMLDPLPGERILDVGCGSGNHLLIFEKLGLDGSGVDPSATMLARARERLAARCRLHQGEAEDLPFEDNEFHLVSLINTLEFVKSPIKALREAGRVASRKVLIVTFNCFSCFGAGAGIRGLFGDPLFRAARMFSIMELKALAAAAYGNAPMTWRSIRKTRQISSLFPKSDVDSFILTRSPFGDMLTVAVTMKYVVKTDNLPIKAKLKEPGLRLVHPRTAEPFKRNSGGTRNEGSLSL